MKYETTQNLIYTGIILLILIAGAGAYMGYQAIFRVNKLEETQSNLRCPKCPTEVNCHLKMPPIKGELIYRGGK